MSKNVREKCPKCSRKSLRELATGKKCYKCGFVENKPTPIPEAQPVSSGAAAPTAAPAAAPQDFPDLNAELAKAQSDLAIDPADIGPNSTPVVPAGVPTINAAGQPAANVSNQISLQAAEGMIKAPFAMLAQVTGCKDLGLTDEEKSELGAHLKAVWDQYAPQWLNENGPVTALSVILLTTCVGKIAVYVDWKKKKRGDANAGKSAADNSGTTAGAGAAQA
jgi:hypothetical protein